MICKRIPRMFRDRWQCSFTGCGNECTWLRNGCAYCDQHHPARKSIKQVKYSFDEKSYTARLACPSLISDVHIVATNEIEARLIINDDITRGLLFGHSVVPTVIACRENRLTGAQMNN